MQAVLDSTKERMEKALDNLVKNFGGVRAGRASPTILDKISVDYYGVPTPIAQMATVSVPEGHTIQIAPWDANMLNAIVKAIQTSDLGINPQNDGKTVRLNFPPLTEERRRELSKEVKGMGEDAKVAVRNIRRDALDRLKNQKKNNELTEDDLSSAEKKVQDLTDQYVREIDGLIAGKEKEIMEI